MWWRPDQRWSEPGGPQGFRSDSAESVAVKYSISSRAQYVKVFLLLFSLYHEEVMEYFKGDRNELVPRWSEHQDQGRKEIVRAMNFFIKHTHG